VEAKPSVAPGQITHLLYEMRQGDREAGSKLMSLLYPDLRRLAAHFMRGERRNHTLQPTALVHEAYLKLARGADPDLQGRAHFFALAAGMMRRILADHARRRGAGKRGGSREKVDLERVLLATGQDLDTVLEIDVLLSRLEQIDARLCKVAELRYLGGLTEQEVSEVMGISIDTVKREWRLAKAWLSEELSKRAPVAAS
jgi:RNA polymerase sigma-70 factor (ECF subfamily)